MLDTTLKSSLSYDLFVVFADADEPWVHGYLLPELGHPGPRLITRDSFRPGAAINAEFERAITSSRFTVLVLSPAFLSDQWSVFGEQLAAHASITGGADRLIPLLREPSDLPLRLDFRVRLDCTQHANWTHEVGRLRGVLGSDHHPSVDVSPPCPYPGIVPFSQEYADYFYGRAEEVDRTLLRLRHQRFVLIIGPSGSGKSSLVHAGIVPAVKRGLADQGRTWSVRIVRPGVEPLQALATAFGGELAWPAMALADVLAKDSPGERLLLVIDQLEELFNNAPTSTQVEFIGHIRALQEATNCVVLATMRADFYADLMGSDLWPIDPSQRVEVVPLRGAALRRAIQQPALDVGVFLEPALVERLVADAASEPGVLPFIQETMQLLWKDRQKRLLTLEAYERLGEGSSSGLAAAVANMADAAYVQLSEDEKRIARRILLCLVQPGDGRPDTRRQQRLEDLSGARDDPRDFAFVLEHLTRNRLVIKSGGDDGSDVRIDLAHEVLILGWPRLRQWLTEDRQERLLHWRLSQATREWRERGHKRDQSFLYGGSRLAEARRYAEEHYEDLSADEVEFLDASAARELVRVRSRYLGQAAGGAVGAALGYGLAFAYAYWMMGQSVGREDLLLLFLVGFPVGQIVGLSIGVALWFWRGNRNRNIVFTTLAGALAGGAAYPILLWAMTVPGVDSNITKQIVTGAILGAALGAGARISMRPRSRFISIVLSGFVAAVLIILYDGTPWTPTVTVVAVVLLAFLTGVGFLVTAIDEPERGTELGLQ
jgi:hypothetical protein